MFLDCNSQQSLFISSAVQQLEGFTLTLVSCSACIHMHKSRVEHSAELIDTATWQEQCLENFEKPGKLLKKVSCDLRKWLQFHSAFFL